MENNKELEYALEHSLDMGDYPDVFPEDFGMDFHLDEHPEWYPKKNKMVGSMRKCVIEISSYCGICVDAIHFYAKIKAGGISICSDSIDKNGKKVTSIHGGYLGEEFKNLPREKQSAWNHIYEIDVSRKVTQKEIDEDPIRWEYYDAGDKTHRFNTSKEAEETAIKVAKARFPKGWIIEVEYI